MAVKTEIEIGINAEGAKSSLDGATDALSQMGEALQGAESAGDAAFGMLDQATGGLASSVKGVIGGIQSFGKTAVTAFRASTAGAGALKKALISTGIGALVVAVGLLVAYWDDIVGYISGASEEQKKLIEDAKEAVRIAEEQLELTQMTENSLRLQGMSEREIRDLKIQQTNEIIAATELQLEQQKILKEQQLEAAERNKEILKGVFDFMYRPVTELLKVIDAVSQGLEYIGAIDEATTLSEDFAGYMENYFNTEEIEHTGNEAIAETEAALLKLKNTRDSYILANQREDQAAADKAAADRQAAYDKEQADAKAHADKMLAIRQAQEAEEAAHMELMSQALDDLYQEQLTAQELELNAVADKYFQLEEFYKDDAETMKFIEEQKQKDLQAIQDKYRAEQLQADKELETAKQKLALDGVGALNAIAQAALEGNDKRARLAFRINKALSLSQAIMSTSQAVTAALAQTTDPTPTQSLRFANAALAGAQGLAQIISISRQQFEPSAGGGGGAASVPRPSAFRPSLSFDAQGLNSGIGLEQSPNLGNQIAESLSGNPIKAYVVSQEVQTQAKMNRKIRETATIG
jgi:hypothetical protein